MASCADAMEVEIPPYADLGDFVKDLEKDTRKALEGGDEELTKRVIEQWNQIAESEYDVKLANEQIDEMEDCKKDVNRHYIKNAAPNLVKFLLENMMKQNEVPKANDEAASLSVAEAAEICLHEVGICLEEDVIPHVWPFIRSNIRSTNWRRSCAAVVALGATLEFTKSNTLCEDLGELFQSVVGLIESNHATIVKESSLFCLGKFCQRRLDVVKTGKNFPKLMTSIQRSFSEDAKSKAQGISAIQNLVESTLEFSILLPHLPWLIDGLIKAVSTSNKEVSGGASEALGALLGKVPPSRHLLLETTVRELRKRLQAAVERGCERGLSKEQERDINCSQENLTAALAGALVRLGAQVPEVWDCFIVLKDVIKRGMPGAHSDAIIAIGSIVTDKFNGIDLNKDPKHRKHMAELHSVLMNCLQAVDESVFSMCLTLISDIAQSFPSLMAERLDEYMNLLDLAYWTKAAAEGSSQVQVMTCIGDVALEGRMEKHVGKIIKIMDNALLLASKSQTVCSPQSPQNGEGKNDDESEITLSLIEAICDMWTGLFQGLRGEDKGMQMVQK